MKRAPLIFGLGVASLMFSSSVQGADLESLALDGYGVLAKTSIEGEFQSCEYERRIPLENGLVFVCSGYSYHYAYSPDVLILKNVKTSQIKVMIDREEFDGQLYR